MACNASLLFPNELPDNCRRATFLSGQQPEYVRLVVRQLRADKVRLVEHARGLANIFVIGKPGEGAQREIWDGGALAEAAM